MKLLQYAKQYGIDEDLLKEFKKAGLLEDVLHEQSSEQIQRVLSSYGCLYTIGFDVYTIKAYIDETSVKGKIKILQSGRAATLEDLHHAKELLDCIDELLYELISTDQVV